MKWTIQVLMTLAVLLSGRSGAAAADPVRGDTAILSAIPADCWGFVQINNLRALDDKLVTFLEQIKLPPMRLIEMLQARLNLGPRITYDGSLAVVFTPADTLADMGTRTVLIFPCASVESLLSDFPTEKIRDNLWRAELVWGPTYVGQQGEFAVFGTTEQAANAVLNGKKRINEIITGPLLEEFKRSDANVWINVQALVTSPAMNGAPGENDQSGGGGSIFGSGSILALNRDTLKQIESAHVGVHLNAARIKITGTIQPVRDSVLAALLEFGSPADPSSLALLPNQPFIVAAAGRATAAQAQIKAAEFDKFLDSETIASGTDPEKLAQFRQALRSVIGAIRDGAWALSTQPQSPEGLIAAVGAFKLTDTQAWLAEIQKAADLLGEGFFVNEAGKRFYNSIRYQPNADTITGVPVHHLVLDLIETSAETPARKIDYSAALGPAKKVIQIAAVDSQTVVVCVGDHPRVMAALIASARGLAPGLDRYTGLAKVKPFLPDDNSIFVLFSPEELIRTGRTLARMQDKVEAFGYQMPRIDTPIGATVARSPAGCRIEAVIPVDLAAALKSMFLDPRLAPPTIDPPPEGN